MAEPGNGVAGLYRTDFPAVEGFTRTAIDHLQIFKFLKMGAVAHSPIYQGYAWSTTWERSMAADCMFEQKTSRFYSALGLPNA
jgi:hypothetical protein